MSCDVLVVLAGMEEQPVHSDLLQLLQVPGQAHGRTLGKRTLVFCRWPALSELTWWATDVGSHFSLGIPAFPSRVLGLRCPCSKSSFSSHLPCWPAETSGCIQIQRAQASQTPPAFLWGPDEWPSLFPLTVPSRSVLSKQLPQLCNVWSLQKIPYLISLTVVLLFLQNFSHCLIISLASLPLIDCTCHFAYSKGIISYQKRVMKFLNAS